MTSGGSSRDGERARRVLYGRRKGRRPRAAQRRALEDVVPALEIALPLDGGKLDPPGLFDRPVRETWLEIGFGAGEHLLAQAAAHPEVGFIGCEPYRPGVVRLARGLDPETAGRVRVWRDDARAVLDRLPDAALSRVFVLFPDPWPKTRHHKRRVICPPVLAALARAMADRAELRIATDDSGYLVWILEHLARAGGFAWTARGPADWRDRPADWPPTRYEAKARAAGRRCVYLRYRRAVGRASKGLSG